MLEEEVVEVAVVAEEAAIVEIEEVVAVALHLGGQDPDSHLLAVVDLLPCRVKK